MPSEPQLPKLFIPGPVDVAPETYAAMARPLIGHRGSDFENLYTSLQKNLRPIAGTNRPIYLSTTSAWGVMEGSIRNLVQTKVLNLCNGAFSDKWHQVALDCGKEAEKIQAEWGQPIDPEAVRTALSRGGFDAVTLIHNETSTGCLNPLQEIAQVVREFDNVLLIVDSVSSFTALPIPFDDLPIDVLLTGVQKALAIPPGLSIFIASQRAIDRAKTTPHRGYYFDFLEFQKNHEKNNTPTTPTIAHLYALQERTSHILNEGLEKRYARHQTTNQMLLDWGEKHGIQPLPPANYRSKTLVCFQTPARLDLPKFIANLRKNHRFLINGGYGKIKGTTFRISNMGNETPQTIQRLLTALDQELPECLHP